MNINAAWQISFDYICITNVYVFFSISIYSSVYYKHASVYMYRHVPMHFIRYLYIYMEEKQESFMKTLSIHTYACCIDLNVNSCFNVSMTFHCCQSRLKCNRSISSLNKLEVDQILWEDFNTIPWGLWKQWSLYIADWS